MRSAEPNQPAERGSKSVPHGRGPRSVVLGVLSMCGSLAAVVWLATSGIASAETLSLEQPRQQVILENSVRNDDVVIKKKVIVEKPKPKKKKKRIDFGAFEGY